MTDNDIIVSECLHCGHKAAFKVHGEYIHEIDSFDEESLVPEDLRDPLLSYVYTWRLLKCLICSKPTLIEIGSLKNYGPQLEDNEYEMMTDDTVTDIDVSIVEAYMPEIDDGTGTWILYPSDKYENMQAPSRNMPKDIANIYNEARSVYRISPRSSAALLRLALQKICLRLGLPGKNINDDIGTLVKQGLSIEIVQAFDIIRIIGNNAVHPLEIDLDEKPKTVLDLFLFLNYIVEDRAIRKRLERQYKLLPDEAKKAIEKRDGK